MTLFYTGKTASFQTFGIAIVAVAALCFNYQMFGLEYYFGDAINGLRPTWR